MALTGCPPTFSTQSSCSPPDMLDNDAPPGWVGSSLAMFRVEGLGFRVLASASTVSCKARATRYRGSRTSELHIFRTSDPAFLPLRFPPPSRRWESWAGRSPSPLRMACGAALPGACMTMVCKCFTSPAQTRGSTTALSPLVRGVRGAAGPPETSIQPKARS